MKMNIDNNLINIIIIRKNIKNIYFRIDDNLNLLVTTNKMVSEKEIIKIINDKIDSIRKMYYLKLNEKDKDAYFYYLGNRYNVIYDDKVDLISFDEENVYVKDDKMLDKFYLKKCGEVFSSRLNENLKLFPNISCGLKIRRMKTRWGVCNRKDNIITLNSELLKKDLSLIDYVIIHEICHFYHPNHSKFFWSEVSKYYPYYKRARKMLRGI